MLVVKKGMNTKNAPAFNLTVHCGVKLNLNLHITGRRGDGYHELSSVVVFSKDFGDIITIRQAPEKVSTDSLKITGKFAADLAAEDICSNLVLRAVALLRRSYPSLPFFALDLQKDVPVASGIGGGSCDAAAVIRALAAHYDLTINAKEYISLGADIPVCLRQCPVIMSGIGEKLKPIQTLPEMTVLLVNPMQKISAMECYKYFKQTDFSFSTPLPPVPEKIDINEWASYLRMTHNDLFAPAAHFCPRLTYLIEVLKSTKDNIYTAMSGSGATCFALFDNRAAALKAKKNILERYPDYWCVIAQI